MDNPATNRLLAPHPGLREFVRAYLIVGGSGEGLPVRSPPLPHPSSRTLLCYAPPAEDVDLRPATAASVAREAIVFRHPGGQRLRWAATLPPCFIVLFHAGGMERLLHLPWSELQLLVIRVGSIGYRPLTDFYRRLRTSSDARSQKQLSDRYLLRCRDETPRTDAAVRSAHPLLLGEHRLGIREIARRVHLSERQFRRRYRLACGITPSVHRRLLQLHRVSEWLGHSPKRSLAAGADRFGYSDASHLHKEFRHFTGFSPRHYLAGQSSVIPLVPE